MGLLIASETVPILLFGLPTGVWVDRRPKRPVMIAADIGRAALLLLVPVAAWLGVLRIELLLVIAFLVGTLSVFFEIASQSYLPVILSTEDLTEGNARLHTGWGIAEVGGPGFGRLADAALFRANRHPGRRRLLHRCRRRSWSAFAYQNPPRAASRQRL